MENKGVDWIRFFGWIVFLTFSVACWIVFIGAIFALLAGAPIQGFEFFWFL